MFANIFSPPLVLGPLNELLAADTSYPVVEAAGGEQVQWPRRVRRWDNPKELLHPVARGNGRPALLCGLPADPRSEGSACSLLFLDRRAHGRRWCSRRCAATGSKAAVHRSQEQVRVTLGTRWSQASVLFTLESRRRLPSIHRWSVGACRLASPATVHENNRRAEVRATSAPYRNSADLLWSDRARSDGAAALCASV